MISMNKKNIKDFKFTTSFTFSVCPVLLLKYKLSGWMEGEKNKTINTKLDNRKFIAQYFKPIQR